MKNKVILFNKIFDKMQAKMSEVIMKIVEPIRALYAPCNIKTAFLSNSRSCNMNENNALLKTK